MNWTDERVELLKKLWLEGLSASQIAAQLGGVTRNAVIGKVHRLKLSGRARASNTQPRQKKATPASAPRAMAARTPQPIAQSVGAAALQTQIDARAASKPDLRPVENVVVPMSRNLSLIQLGEHTCKWPNGDPLAEDFSFCGNEAEDGSPYCHYHGRLAYQPASERKRVR